MSIPRKTAAPERVTRAGQVRPWLVPAALGLGALLLTLLLWQLTLFQSRVTDQIRFEKLSGVVLGTIQQRLHQHENALDGIKGLYAASKSVERGEFREYVKSIDLPDYHGALGFGFIRYVPRANLESFLIRTQADEAPEFTLRSSGQQPDLFIIEYIEPLARNRAAQGFDISSEALRREAATQAVEKNGVTLTRHITLVQDEKKRPGFLLLHPIYANQADASTPAERWRSLVGWAFASIQIDRLMEGIVAATANQVDFELFEDDQANRSALIYDDDGHLADSSAPQITEAEFTSRLFHQAKGIDIGGKHWLLHTSTRPEFSAGTDHRLSWLVLISGIIFSGLLAYAANSSQRVKKEAVMIANEMTLELREENLLRQKLNANLSEVSLFQKAILESAAYAIISTTPEGLIRVFNPAAQRMLGYTGEEMIGRQTPAIFHDSTEVIARAKELSAELGCPVEPGFEVFVIKSCHGLPNEHEWTYVRKDGTRLPVLLSITALRDDQGNFTGFLGMAIDISERNRAWADLLQSRQASDEARHEMELIRDALDQHAIVSITDPVGKILHANERFLTISGYSRAELIGQTHRIINSGYHPPEFWKNFWQTIRAGNVWHGEVCNRSKTGQLYWMDATDVPFHDAQGKISRFIGIRTDITARKLAEAELLQARKIAEAANQSKSEFLAEMSHEIRTPMNAVLGFTELLALTSLNEKQRNFVETIQFSGNNLLTIINDILDYSKIEAGKLEVEKFAFDAVDTIESVLKILSLQAKKKSLTLGIQALPGAPQLIIADPTRVRQVLFNLIGNALKFTKQGGVTITLEPESSGDQACLRFNISDTGIGLSPAQQAKLFTKYTQAQASTTREFGGTGLGLAICKRLVELMGGAIGVMSAENQGSTFWFTLPVAEVGGALVAPLSRCETSSQPTPATVPNELSVPVVATAVSAPRPWHVLVVDDNPINLQLGCAFLAKLDCETTTAQNGEEAATLVQQKHFDLVLMDYQMPVMNGMQATTAIRHWEFAQPGKKRLPIVALTANLSPDAANNFIACGMDACLGKPLLLGELKEIMGKLIPASLTTPPITIGTTTTAARANPENTAAMDRERALQLTDNNPALLGMLAQAFLAQCDGLMASIQQALQARNASALKAHAHKLKGSISVFAAAQAFAPVLALNKFPETPDWPQLDLQGQQLALEIARLKPELLALNSAPSPPP